MTKRYTKEFNNLVQTDLLLQEAWLDVEALRVPPAQAATMDDVGIGIALGFRTGQKDTVYARVKVPLDMYPGLGFQMFIGWSTPTANAGNCRWQAEYLYRSPNEAMDAVADDTLTEDFPASTTGHGLVVSTIGTIPAPSLTDACLEVRIKRLGDHLNDTIGETLFLYGVCFRYYTDRLKLIGV